MKFHQIILLIIVLVFSSSIGYGQCTTKVDFDSSVEKNQTGSIEVTLNESEQYSCKLFEYKNGNKMLVETKTGNSTKFRFQNLSIGQYYRVEISFSDIDELLCRSLVSELIQFKN